MAGQFSKRISNTGGSAQRLSTVLAAAGYTDSYIGVELALRVPTSVAASMFVGGSTVNASTGQEIGSGESYTWNSTGVYGDVVDVAQMYLFTTITQNFDVTFRGK